MGEMANYYIDEAMGEAFGANLLDEYHRPIWTDIHGKKYWQWEDITDSHLLNIIKSLEKRDGPAELIAKFKRQARKRALGLKEKE